MEIYFTYPFNSLIEAEKNRKEIEMYFEERINKSWIEYHLHGFMVYYLLKN
jgi:hypothetical protein